MHGPPENERGGLGGAASQEVYGNTSQTATSADVPEGESESNPNPQPCPAVGEASAKIIMDAQWRGYAETVRAPEALRNRLMAACSCDILNEEKIQLARVRFESHRFDFDEDGIWAIVAPIWQGGYVVNLAAFALDDSEKRKTYQLGGFAIGFDMALFDASYHPQGWLTVHFDVWSWLRSECVGCVPIDWKAFGIALHEWSVLGVLYPDQEQARRADLRLHRAMQRCPRFVMRDDEKVAA